LRQIAHDKLGHYPALWQSYGKGVYGGKRLAETRARVGVGTIFLRFLRLGCTSFGGPVAHLGYFREEFVARLGWLEEAAFAEIVGLCQFLPGPASSQVGFTIGLTQGGVPGALAAWAGFTLPSAVLMFAFAYGHRLLTGRAGAGLLHGLQLVAVAVVAQAVWGMAQRLTPDARRVLIAGVAAGVVLWLQTSAGQLVALGIGAVAGWLFCREVEGAADGWSIRVSRRLSLAAGVAFAVLLVGPAVLLAVRPTAGVELFAAFYRAGALVFGGGHVVLPLLQSATVGRGWVDEATFLSGYGGAQAVPGPLVTFAAFLGAVCRPVPGLGGAVIALLGIFLPGMLLILAVLPWWSRLRSNAGMRAAIAGVNASVVGILLAALYRPVWTSAVDSVWDMVIVLAAFAALVVGKMRPVIVVGVVATIGALAGLAK
jgi:chromate transporter